MDTEYWISELGRLYLRSDEAIREEQFKAVEPLANEFNEILEQLQDAYPDNPIVQNTEEVRPYTEDRSGSSGNVVTIAPPTRRDQALHEVRSRAEKIANAIGYDLPEPEARSTSTSQMVMVQVEQNQEATQEVHQEVTVEQIQQTIQSLPRPSSQKEELEEVLDEFEAELEGEQDESRLRRLLSKASDISEDVAAQMAMRALTYGITGILTLGT